MPADLINVFTSQLPTVMLGHYTKVSTIGQYNMSNRFLGLPAVFLSGAITDVFKQRASKDFHETGTYRPIFLKTFKTLSLLALPPFLIVGIFGADIFEILLGSQWRQAGTISQLLALMFFFKFIVSPLSYIIYIAGKNWFSFVMDSIGFIASYLVFRFFLPDVYMAFMLYAGVYVVLSAITLLFCYYTK
jgi:O-antigen/teichoic acid export membrane protein